MENENVIENKEVFRNKNVVCVSLDKDVAEKLNTTCNKYGKSKFINQVLKEYFAQRT